MNELIKKSLCICSGCDAQILGDIVVRESQVFLNKNCPHCKETSSTLIEPDSKLYLKIQSVLNQGRNINNDGNFCLLLEITKKCNTQCKYCYYPIDNNTNDLTVEEVLDIIKRYPEFNMVFLSGGEPTCHSDLTEIRQELANVGCFAYILTNGLKFANMDFLEQMMDSGWSHQMDDNSYQLYAQVGSCIGSDFKNENIYQLKKQMYDNFRTKHVKVNLGYTVDSLDELDIVLAHMQEYRDIINGQVRIRKATKIWNTLTESPLFLSDLYHHMEKRAEEAGVEFGLCTEYSSNHYHISCVYNGIQLLIATWPGKYTADVEEYKDYSPRTLALDGTHNFFLYRWDSKELDAPLQR